MSYAGMLFILQLSYKNINTQKRRGKNEKIIGDIIGINVSGIKFCRLRLIKRSIL